MSKRLTQEEKDKRVHDKAMTKKEREKRREKELRHKRWLKAEKARIRKKTQRFEQIKRLQKKNVLYEHNLKEFADLTLGLDVMSVQRDIVYPFYRFFFPYKMATPTGKLNPIEGFSTEVALRFIDILIKAGASYGHNYQWIYDMFCNHRMTGRELIKAYNNGVDSYKKLYPGVPPELLYRLYNIRVPGSTAHGAGEYLLCLKISDVIKGKNGDICTKTGIDIEAKAYDGRLNCQVPSDTEAVDDYFHSDARFMMSSNRYTLLNNGMIDCYKRLKKLEWDDKCIIELFAECKIQTYKKYLEPHTMTLFVTEMAREWDKFFINGEFTEESINMINGCHDAYVYPLLEKFTHLKVDTKQPSSISKANEFDVHFKIFDRRDFSYPKTILNLIESNQIKFYGLIKNNGRDKSVHVGI